MYTSKFNKVNSTALPLITLACILLLCCQGLAVARLSGAIFTTTVDGSIVNENVRYQFKEDVYLDGGPGPNAPIGAAGLPEGDYYFQVTDPSGKKLLSQDAVECRRFHVNADGVIDGVVPANGLTPVATKGRRKKVVLEVNDCEHDTGIDIDHNAVTVQLMPYEDTPNKGGVYKVWVTPVEDFVGDPTKVDNPDFFHGFVPAWSKTDNYKVKGRKCDATATIQKFRDDNANGVWDGAEPELNWEIKVTDPLAVINYEWTPVENLLLAPAGIWTFEELFPAGEDWLQTALILDGTPLAVNPLVSIDVAGECDESYTIVYGNIELACITACKYYDADGDGDKDAGEPNLPGIRFDLTGTNIRGDNVSESACTGSDGCVSFCDLLPGIYTLTEVLPAGNWVATTPQSIVDILLEQGDDLAYEFGNYCYEEGVADFSTKGYWHNKNGLTELQSDPTLYAEVLAYVNGLDPYDGPSGYFGKGDKPFDGEYAGGAPVPAGKGVLDEVIAPEGSIEAEISHFLVDSNGDGGTREQLAQQLLAFIFNVYYRIGSPAALIDGDSASDIIDDAIEAWATGTQAERTAIKDTLDAYNNSDAVSYTLIYLEPCDFEPQCVE